MCFWWSHVLIDVLYMLVTVPRVAISWQLHVSVWSDKVCVELETDLEGLIYTATLTQTSFSWRQSSLGWCCHLHAWLWVCCSFSGVQCGFCAKCFGTMTKNFNLVYSEHNTFSYVLLRNTMYDFVKFSQAWMCFIVRKWLLSCHPTPYPNNVKNMGAYFYM